MGNSVVSFSNAIDLVRIRIESLPLLYFFLRSRCPFLSCALGPQRMQCAIQLAKPTFTPSPTIPRGPPGPGPGPCGKGTNPGTFSKCCGLVDVSLYDIIYFCFRVRCLSTSSQSRASWHPRVEIRIADLRESS